MAEARGVLVIGEVSAGQLSGTTKEVLAAGRPLAATGWYVAGGWPGRAVSSQAPRRRRCRLGATGSTRLTMPCSLRCTWSCTWRLSLSCAAAVAPDIILLGRTALGRDLGPRLACRLGVGVLQDCLRVELDADEWSAHRHTASLRRQCAGPGTVSGDATDRGAASQRRTRRSRLTRHVKGKWWRCR